MQYSNAGLELTKHFEGCRLEAYQDVAGVWTIGYGHTHRVKRGDTCTQEQADAWLHEDMSYPEESVNEMVRVPLSQNQFDALCDFTFNLGHSSLEKSHLLAMLNNKDYEGAATEFPRWNQVRVNGHYENCPGLTRRRLAEQAMFRGEPWQ